MLSYLLIALGGAVGSVLRAALGGAMLALTGPSFPWGTILINVLGSFAIGCFGSLTALDGRFALPAEARTFVMVGICGGFTTFSSFSLQTLDLFRDGRPGQAALNIGLSVALCVGSVWLGALSGTALRESRLAAAGPIGAGVLADRTLVALHTPESAPTLLAAAAAAMARSGDRTTVLAIDGPVLRDLRPTEELLTVERQRELAARRGDWLAALRPTLDRWVDTEKRAGFGARWVPVRGDGVPALAEHARGAHLLIMEHEPNDPGSAARLRAALDRGGRPVLLVPRGAALPELRAEIMAEALSGRRDAAGPVQVRRVASPFDANRDMPEGDRMVLLIPQMA